MRERILRGVLAMLVLGLTVRCGPGITSDEFHCEAAMAHLADCCPGFPLHEMTCESVPQGCGYTLRSQLDLDEADCLRAQSCRYLVDNGICDVVPTLPVSDGTSGRAPVCP